MQESDNSDEDPVISEEPVASEKHDAPSQAEEDKAESEVSKGSMCSGSNEEKKRFGLLKQCHDFMKDQSARFTQIYTDMTNKIVKRRRRAKSTERTSHDHGKG